VKSRIGLMGIYYAATACSVPPYVDTVTSPFSGTALKCLGLGLRAVGVAYPNRSPTPHALLSPDIRP
jgi:hypothetical protein